MSGLSGTVVLEDNGGDDLSVSANGTFTFATQLAQNAAYDVTVKTYPSGAALRRLEPVGDHGHGQRDQRGRRPAPTWWGRATHVQYVSTDANGVQYLLGDVRANGPGTPDPPRPAAQSSRGRGGAQLRLRASGRSGPVGTNFGDGLDTLESLDAQDQYNLTVIEPTFGADPWYADNPNTAGKQYETFMTQLQPGSRRSSPPRVTEQNWLIGFSKSGIGAQDLILKHPDLFQLAASWDFPADMSSYDQFGQSSIRRLRHRRQFPGELPPDPGVRRRPQGAVHGQEQDLDRRLQHLPDRHLRL